MLFERVNLLFFSFEKERKNLKQLDISEITLNKKK